jgi:hypothetical protein
MLGFITIPYQMKYGKGGTYIMGGGAYIRRYTVKKVLKHIK